MPLCEVFVTLREGLGTTRAAERPPRGDLKRGRREEEEEVEQCKMDKPHPHILTGTHTLRGGFLVMWEIRKFMAMSSQFM